MAAATEAEDWDWEVVAELVRVDMGVVVVRVGVVYSRVAREVVG